MSYPTGIHGGNQQDNAVSSVTTTTATTTRTTRISRYTIDVQQPYRHRYYSTTSVRFAPPLRRRREYEGQYKKAQQQSQRQQQQQSIGNLDAPIDYGDDIDDYLQNKASLSPWVPVPDVVARKIFDLVEQSVVMTMPSSSSSTTTATSQGTEQGVPPRQPEYVHVDLGSGDGRVNFHAIDYTGVHLKIARSIGIDSDENVLKVANERLRKRHPQPDVRFVKGDLNHPTDPSWDLVFGSSGKGDDDGTATSRIVTMYFVTEALVKIRPILEERIAGRKNIRIVTIGYEMPGWQSSMSEVVLGTQIHLYNFGIELDHDEDEDDDGTVDFFLDGNDADTIISERPDQLTKNMLESKEFEGSNIIDHTGKYPIRGYNPEIFHDRTGPDDGDDNDDDFWGDEDDDEDDENGKTADKDRSGDGMGKTHRTGKKNANSGKKQAKKQPKCGAGKLSK